MTTGRIPCLDGLRAISIFGVILAHAAGTQGFPAWAELKFLGDLGNLGVRVFFVISGYLITYLLMKESAASGTISLGQFYLRRTFRIFPAFYFYLGCLGVLVAIGLISVPAKDFGLAASYLINFVHKKDWEVGHLWSLAVEEQFYLIWPAAILWLGWRRATWAVILVVLAAPLLRIGTWYLLPDLRGIITKAFPTVCDTIAIGCVLALLRSRLLEWEGYGRFVASKWFVVVPALVLLSNSFASHTRPDLLVGQSIRNIGIALILDWCLRFPDSAVGRVLNLRWMVWIGTLSYSFYLWQQLFLNRTSEAVWCAFPLNIVLAASAALGSYYLVERPVLRLRSRLAPPKRPGERVQKGPILTVEPHDVH